MLKIGVLGVGHLGKIHIRCINDLPVFEIVGFFDPNDAVAEEVEKTYGLKRFLNVDELISQVDVVDIVTPTSFHYELAKKSIKKLKHIFIEKPVANTPDEAKDLLRLSVEAGVKVQIGHVERFNPALRAVTDNYTLNPMFIEAHRLSIFNPRGTDVSIVLDLMIHDIDIVLSVVKSSIKNISASGVAIVSATPDIANARIEFENGCVANLTASRISMKNMRKSRFFQKDAYISVDYFDKTVEIIKMSDTNESDNPMAMEIDLGGERGKKVIQFEKPEVKSTNAIRDELESFANAILTNTQPLISIEDGYIALKTAFQILQQIEKNINAINVL